MPLAPPAPSAADFAAGKGDGEAMAHCFTEQAIVKGEGQRHFFVLDGDEIASLEIIP